MQARNTVCVSICVALVFCCPSSLAVEQETCVAAPDERGPDFTCVAWEAANPPERGLDFTVSFQQNPFAPDVVLKTGSTTWRVWSIVDEQSQDPGVIGCITATQAENYIVKIANGAGAGAANLGDINLNTSGDHFSAVQDGSHISGNLSGTVFVEEDSGGAGGFLKMTVDGNVSRSLTADTIDLWIKGNVTSSVVITAAGIISQKQLRIDGDLAGDISITDEITSGDLTVAGTIASTASITINDIRKTTTEIPEIRLGTSGTDPVEGDLILTSGIKADVLVVLSGALNGAGPWT